MPVPIVNAMTVCLRQALKPVNRATARQFQPYDKLSPAFRAVSSFGHGCYKFETKLNAAADGIEVQPIELKEEVAFVKGVEWFNELVFFYGLLSGIAFWEVRKYSQRKVR